MPKKIDLSEKELAEFRQAVSGTKPLNRKKNRLSNPAPKYKNIIPKQHKQLDALEFREDANLASVNSETTLSYKKPDLPNKILRKLRRGQYTIEARLDLHGMSTENAQDAVDQFIRECLCREQRVILIIHGKGRQHNHMPILKNKLNQWLRHLPAVLAFCSATPAHGSRGAVYVLLKHYSKEPSA